MTNQLTNSKRKFIENWRKNVSEYMEHGNICRLTIAALTPEPDNSLKWASPDHNRTLTDLSPRHEMASPTLPAVKFSYSHVNDDVIKTSKSQNRRRTERNNRSQSRPVLPPSPNGVMVQNGKDINLHRQHNDKDVNVQRHYNGRDAGALLHRKHSLILHSVENDSQDVSDVDDQKKSKQLAMEIYEKYNMKSSTHNMLPGKQRPAHVTEHYSMPWRNKTFLTLPLRFNGNMKTKNKNLRREKSYLSEINYNMDSTEDLKFNTDWNDVMNW